MVTTVEDAVVARLKPLASKDMEVTLTNVPLASPTSTPRKVPSVLKSVPHEKRPADQVSFPVVGSQADRLEPKSWEEEAKPRTSNGAVIDA